MSTPHVPFRGGELSIVEDLLRGCCRPRMICVDLGSYVGNSSLKILSIIKPFNGHLYCVDWFRGNEGAPPQQLIYGTYGRDGVLESLLNALDQELAVHATVIIGTTADVARVMADGVVDFIFLDADHRYDAVKLDLQAWWPKVRPGGIFCGHDFDIPLALVNRERAIAYQNQDMADGIHYGVVLAVSEQFPRLQQRDNIWWVRKE